MPYLQIYLHIQTLAKLDIDSRVAWFVDQACCDLKI